MEVERCYLKHLKYLYLEEYAFHKGDHMLGIAGYINETPVACFHAFSLVSSTGIPEYRERCLHFLRRGASAANLGRSYPLTMMEQNAMAEHKKMVLQFEFSDGRSRDIGQGFCDITRYRT